MSTGSEVFSGLLLLFISEVDAAVYFCVVTDPAVLNMQVANVCLISVSGDDGGNLADGDVPVLFCHGDARLILAKASSSPALLVYLNCLN